MAFNDVFNPLSSYYPVELDIMRENGNRIGIGDLSFSDLIEKFDISRFPDWENAAEPYLSYVVMSRPDLNGSTANKTVLQNHTMTSAFYNDAYGKKLFHSLSNKTPDGSSNSNMFLPLITTRAMSYQTVDVAIRTVEKSTTFYGHVIKYGKHSEEHKVGGSISIDFRNDRFLSILKMIYLWMCYIWLVSKTGDIEPIMEYQRNGVLDYAASIYYFVVRRDNRELVFWEKLTGVFPKTDQFSMFSSSDDFILQDKITIEFDYGIRSDPCDPEVLIDLNMLSGLTSTKIRKMASFNTKNKSGTSAKSFTKDPFVTGVGGVNNIAFANSLETPFALGNSFAAYPFAHTMRMEDDSLRYYLDWVKD